MYGLYSKTHKTAIEMMVRIAERPRQSPPAVKAPSWDERVKVRWTDELIARLLDEFLAKRGTPSPRPRARSVVPTFATRLL